MATPSTPATAVVEKFCIVCGQGSHRLDWQSRDNPTCDTHSPDEVKAAIARLKLSPAPPAVEK